MAEIKTFKVLAAMFLLKHELNNDGTIKDITIRGDYDNNQLNAPEITIPSHHFLALKLGINIHDGNNNEQQVPSELRNNIDFKIFLHKLILYNSYKSKDLNNIISEVDNYFNGQSGGKRKRLKTKTNKRKRTKSKTNKRKKRTRRRR